MGFNNINTPCNIGQYCYAGKCSSNSAGNPCDHSNGMCHSSAICKNNNGKPECGCCDKCIGWSSGDQPLQCVEDYCQTRPGLVKQKCGKMDCSMNGNKKDIECFCGPGSGRDVGK